MAFLKEKTANISFFLYWSSIALFGIFVVKLLRVLFSSDILKDVWILRVSSALQNQSIMALLGMIILLIAGLENSATLSLKGQVMVMRRIAAAASIAFLLLIPLQAWSGFKILN